VTEKSFENTVSGHCNIRFVRVSSNSPPQAQSPVTRHGHLPQRPQHKKVDFLRLQKLSTVHQRHQEFWRNNPVQFRSYEIGTTSDLREHGRERLKTTQRTNVHRDQGRHKFIDFRGGRAGPEKLRSWWWWSPVLIGLIAHCSSGWRRVALNTCFGDTELQDLLQVHSSLDKCPEIALISYYLLVSSEIFYAFPI
jgi:hypothetical protein